MALNNKNNNLPHLVIDEESNVLSKDEIVYLGDVFNRLGNNDGLIADRVRRGTKAMVTIMSLMAETDVGVHKISTMLLLYTSLFLSTMLFNSQSWSKIRPKQMEKLKVIQLRYLKRILGLANSTCNSFLFLELGVLPINFEIDKRRLMYLHRILNLEESDPVYITFQNMASFVKAGEENWWSEVEVALHKYGLPTDLDEIRELKKETFRKMVNEAVEDFAFKELTEECKGLKKTSCLSYESLKLQDYLKKMYPNQAKILFKCRSKTLDIKTHLTYKYRDSMCRKCGECPEEVQHIINCGREQRAPVVDYITMDVNSDQYDVEVKLMVSSIVRFLEEVEK